MRRLPLRRCIASSWHRGGDTGRPAGGWEEDKRVAEGNGIDMEDVMFTLVHVFDICCCDGGGEWRVRGYDDAKASATRRSASGRADSDGPRSSRQQHAGRARRIRQTPLAW